MGRGRLPLHFLAWAPLPPEKLLLFNCSIRHTSQVASLWVVKYIFLIIIQLCFCNRAAYQIHN